MSLKAYFEDVLKLNPSFSVFLGDKTKEHLYENPLSNAYMKKADAIHEKHSGHSRHTGHARHAQENTIDDQILTWIIDQYRAGKPYEYVMSPITSFENPIISFSFLNTSLYSNDPKKLLQRQKGFMSYIKDCQKRLQHPQHRTMPRLICERIISSLESYIDKKAYIVATGSADAAYVAFADGPYRLCLVKMLNFLKKDYLPQCRETVGICHLPEGRDLYRLMIRSNTTLDDSPDDIHAYGLKEVRRLTRELQRNKVALGFDSKMPLKEFLDAMTHDVKNSFTTAKGAIDAYVDARKQIEQEVLQDLFHEGVAPYEVQPVPKEMQTTSAGAFYMPGNGTRPGVFYVNLRDPKECHKYSVLALSLHEGNPGHHYQFQYMLEQNVPLYRQYVYHNTALIEGWALYAESLMDFSKRPYDKLGRLTYDMFRALRLVVDTGIHWKGWTYEKAVSYMSSHLAMSKSEIETEVQRYICIPAQALCYKLGEREILKMKHQYLKRFGKRAIKDFHTEILKEGTSVPLRFLIEKIDRLCKG